MSKLQELRKEAQEVAGKMQAAADAHAARKKALDDETDPAKRDQLPPEWDDTTTAEWRGLNEQYDGLKARCENEEKTAQMAAVNAEAQEWLARSMADPNNRPGSDDTVPGSDSTTYGDLGVSRDQARQLEKRERQRHLALQSYFSFGIDGAEITEEHRQACVDLNFDPSVKQIRMQLLPTENHKGITARLRRMHPDRRADFLEDWAANGAEQRALSAGLGATGGFVVIPATAVRQLEVAMLGFGQFLAEMETISTTTGEDMPWPILDDTNNSASYTDENVDNSAEVDPAFESVTWGSHDLRSGMVKIPTKLNRDSFININNMVTAALGVRFARKLNTETTTGVDKIRGLIARSPVGQTAAGAAIAYDDVIGLEHSLDISRRAGAKYMFHDAQLERLRLIKDDQSRPLFSSNIAAGVPDTFGGRPYVINQDMDNGVATGDNSMAFGQLMSYKLRRVGAIRVLRLVERYAEFDQTAFLGYLSADGNLLRPNTDALCPVQLLQHP
mgnify:CR=1 FL=1|tara:strand:+ start:5757 stop:7262 length:1506 start_codon:yes stop_codon:yes gene_type:complete